MMPKDRTHDPESGLQVTEHDRPGHFICADRCRWFRHHHVGRWCVSSVGEYDRDGDGTHHAIGGRGPGEPPQLYETMVFQLDEDYETEDWSERDSDRYATRAEAEAGHKAMIAKVQGWEQPR